MVEPTIALVTGAHDVSAYQPLTDAPCRRHVS